MNGSSHVHSIRFVNVSREGGIDALTAAVDESLIEREYPQREIISGNSNEAREFIENNMNAQTALAEYREQERPRPPDPPPRKNHRKYPKNMHYTQEHRDYFVKLLQEHGKKWTNDRYAKEVGASADVINKWKSQLKKTGSLQYKKNRNLTRVILKEDHLRHIADEIVKAPDRVTLKSLATSVKEKFPEVTSLSLSTVSRSLKGDRMKDATDKEFSAKVLSERPEAANTPENKELRWRRLTQLIAYKDHGYTWVSVDETHWQLGPQWRKGWSEVGKKAYSTSMLERTQYSSITAIDYYGNAPHCLIVKGKVTRPVFKQFFRELVNQYSADEPCVFFMDNCSIHGEDIIQEVLEGTNHHYLFNAPYSQELNPIEMFFSQWKYQVSERTREYPGMDEFIDTLQEAVMAITRQSIRRLFRHVENEVFAKVLGREDL